MNWRPHRFKWTRPFRRKTKFGFCARAITFRTHYITPLPHTYNIPSPSHSSLYDCSNNIRQGVHIIKLRQFQHTIQIYEFSFINVSKISRFWSFIGSCKGIRIYVYNTTNFVKILTIFYFSLMHGDKFRLCLQPSSGQLVVQIRYKWCAYDMGSHKDYMCSISEVIYTMERWH